MTQAHSPLRVLVVDDELPARRRLRELLADVGVRMPIEVAGEAANGRDALDRVAELAPIWCCSISACRKSTASKWPAICKN